MKSPLELPRTLDAEFGRALVAELGGDPEPIEDEWCWRDFARAYPELREKAEAWFAAATAGEAAWAAYCMAYYCGSSRKWAERVIAAATAGDPSWAAYCMARDCGSSREWAEGVIAAAKTGTPADAAYWMVNDCGSSSEWAKEVAAREDSA